MIEIDVMVIVESIVAWNLMIVVMDLSDWNNMVNIEVFVRVGCEVCRWSMSAVDIMGSWVCVVAEVMRVVWVLVERVD